MTSLSIEVALSRESTWRAFPLRGWPSRAGKVRGAVGRQSPRLVRALRQGRAPLYLRGMSGQGKDARSCLLHLPDVRVPVGGVLMSRIVQALSGTVLALAVMAGAAQCSTSPSPDPFKSCPPGQNRMRDVTRPSDQQWMCVK